MGFPILVRWYLYTYRYIESRPWTQSNKQQIDMKGNSNHIVVCHHFSIFFLFLFYICTVFLYFFYNVQSIFSVQWSFTLFSLCLLFSLFFISFLPEALLAYGYCHRLCLCVCVSVCLSTFACPSDNSSHVPPTITWFGQKDAKHFA